MSHGIDQTSTAGAPSPLCQVCTAPLRLSARKPVSIGPKSPPVDMSYYRCTACDVEHPVIGPD